MKFRTKIKTRLPVDRTRTRAAGFTLAEVLAALAVMAIVIPVAIHGLQVANLAGVVAQRKALAVRVGERVLTEAVVARQWNQPVQSGTEQQGPYQFNWTMHNDAWNQNVVSPSAINLSALHQLSVEVTFAAQNKNYSVRLSTLVNTLQQ
jgi:prepilin-type N-terminal cleavage/methylation domain-containing protein